MRSFYLPGYFSLVVLEIACARGSVAIQLALPQRRNMIYLIPYAQLEGDALADSCGCPVGPRLVALFLTWVVLSISGQNTFCSKLYFIVKYFGYSKTFGSKVTLCISVQNTLGKYSMGFPNL